MIGVGVGYWLGRDEGMRLGEQRGRALCPLELREQALLGGVCPTCSGLIAATVGENCQAGCAMVEWTEQSREAGETPGSRLSTGG